MNFKIFTTKDNKKIKKTFKRTNNFLSKDKEMSIFHSNNFTNCLTHVVFHVPDEYSISSKIGKNSVNMPFSQYVNCFIFKEYGYFLIENITNEYTEEIVNFIYKELKIKLFEVNLTNDIITKVIFKLDGFIKKLDYTDDEEDFIELESIKFDKYNVIQQNYKLDYVLINVDKRFISFNPLAGIVSVDNSDADYLIKFTEEIINAIVC